MTGMRRDPGLEFSLRHPGAQVFARTSGHLGEVTMFHVIYGEHGFTTAVSDTQVSRTSDGAADFVLAELERSWDRMREEVSKVPA